MKTSRERPKCSKAFETFKENYVELFNYHRLLKNTREGTLETQKHIFPNWKHQKIPFKKTFWSFLLSKKSLSHEKAKWLKKS